MESSRKKLYRSKTDRFIGGVCGGLAEYFNIDSTIVRILLIVLVFIGGSGVLLYILSLIIIPLNPDIPVDEHDQTTRKRTNNLTFFLGVAFIIFGILLLFHNMGFIPYRFWHMRWDLFFAIALIIVGIYIMLREPQSLNTEVGSDSDEPGTSSERNIFHKSITDKKIFGVCGGIAEYLNIDSSIVRIGWIFFVFASAGLAFILYLILALVLPEKKLVNS